MNCSFIKTHPSKKKLKSDFKPDRAFVEKAVKEFLESGGKITKIDILPDPTWCNNREGVYEFLLDEKRVV